MARIAARIDMRIAAAAALLLFTAVLGVPPADAWEAQTCEECDFDKPNQTYIHNFPSNSGETDCESGDGCHGIDYADGKCDVHESTGCAVDPDSLDSLFVAAETGRDPWAARGTINEGQLQLDRESGLLLVYSCGDRIAASIPLSAEQIATLTN